MDEGSSKRGIRERVIAANHEMRVHADDVPSKPDMRRSCLATSMGSKLDSRALSDLHDELLALPDEAWNAGELLWMERC